MTRVTNQVILGWQVEVGEDSSFIYLFKKKNLIRVWGYDSVCKFLQVVLIAKLVSSSFTEGPCLKNYR